MKTALIPILLATILLGSAEVRAQDAAAVGSGFGEQGQIVVDANLRGGFAYVKQSLNNASRSQSTFSLTPGLLYFVAPNVAVGGVVAFAHTSVKEGNAEASLTSMGLGPTGAYNLHLSPLASLLPQVQLLYVRDSTENDLSAYTISFRLAVPVLIHLAPHLFLGVGPEFSRSFVSKVSQGSQSADGPSLTTFAIGALIGGWF